MMNEGFWCIEDGVCRLRRKMPDGCPRRVVQAEGTVFFQESC